MKIIPVLDILNNTVVHARGGIRDKYHPLKTSLFPSSDPVDIVVKFEEMGFRDLYLADLDSIIKKQTNFSLFERIRDYSKINLMVDAGVTNKELATALFKRNIKKVIIGTETLISLAFLEKAINFFGEEKIVLSLDLMNGNILNKFNLKDQKKPVVLLEKIEKLGISQIIILDLKRVGSKKGVDIELVNNILKKFDFDIYVGGGIRNLDDIVKLHNLGVSGSLIGTALYLNLIDIAELKEKKLM